jgi:hypothetical protein
VIKLGGLTACVEAVARLLEPERWRVSCLVFLQNQQRYWGLLEFGGKGVYWGWRLHDHSFEPSLMDSLYQVLVAGKGEDEQLIVATT